MIHIDLSVAQECIQKRAVRYDKSGDSHYDTISAFIKSMRGSDPDAAVYYLARMLYAGEDIKFIARRIMICASEDVGNADPQALTCLLYTSALPCCRPATTPIQKETLLSCLVWHLKKAVRSLWESAKAIPLVFGKTARILMQQRRF